MDHNPSSVNPAAAQNPDDPQHKLIHVSFNQDSRCFAACTTGGFRIYRCDRFREMLRRDVVNRRLGAVELWRCCSGPTSSAPHPRRLRGEPAPFANQGGGMGRPSEALRLVAVLPLPRARRPPPPRLPGGRPGVQCPRLQLPRYEAATPVRDGAEPAGPVRPDAAPPEGTGLPRHARGAGAGGALRGGGKHHPAHRRARVGRRVPRAVAGRPATGPRPSGCSTPPRATCSEKPM